MTVSDTVLDVSGSPLNGAQVTITSAPFTVYTDSSGIFSAGIEAGDHNIVIKKGPTTIYTSYFTFEEVAFHNFGDIIGEYCDFTGWEKHL